MERATRGHTEGRRESQRGRRRKAGHQVQSEPVGSSKTALNKPPPDCRSSTLVLPEPPTLYTELEEQNVGIILTAPNQRGPMWSMLPDTLS